MFEGLGLRRSKKASQSGVEPGLLRLNRSSPGGQGVSEGNIMEE